MAMYLEKGSTILMQQMESEDPTHRSSNLFSHATRTSFRLSTTIWWRDKTNDCPRVTSLAANSFDRSTCTQ